MPHFDKIVSPFFATLLMSRNPYLPSVVSSFIIVFCIILLQNVKSPGQAPPITSHEAYDSTDSLINHDDQHNTTNDAGDASSSESPVASSSDISACPTDSPPPANVLVTQTLISQFLHRIGATLTFINQNPILSFCYLAFYLKSVAMASEAFVFQYLSEKFGWLLQDTTILRFALSFGAVLSTLVIGPLISSSLARRGVSTPKIDVGIICSSLLLLTACFMVAWRAETSAGFVLCLSSRYIS